MRPAARFLLRTVALFGLFVSAIAGAWFAVDRLIVSADGPHQETVLIRVSPRVTGMPRSAGH